MNKEKKITILLILNIIKLSMLKKFYVFNTNKSISFCSKFISLIFNFNLLT